MLILAVDTSTRRGSAAILRDSEVLAEVSGSEETPYSTRLFRDVALLQSMAQFKLDQVDVFAVAAGPGSFTGLRVGLTAVKAWAEVHRKPIAAISGLEAIVAEAVIGENRSAGDLPIARRNEQCEPSSGSTNGRFLAPFFDARRGQVFGAIYRRVSSEGKGLALAGEESIVSPQEFLELVKACSCEPAVLISPTPDVLSATLVGEVLRDARIVRVSGSLAPAIGRLGFERARSGNLTDPMRLDANYVRRSDAEAAWKDG
jgi:tRNA threonylcarbamoyladenosine biosynthesis protein TsaB